MKIQQFEYKPLAHYSYALISEGEMVVIDPGRDPLPYYGFAKENNAEIKAVIETHPHADFISSHLQIHKETGAIIYNSKLTGASYPHSPFDDGDSIKIGKVGLRAINTPGHSPDSITIVAEDADDIILFTGDTLFAGDVGRPDLREKSGNTKAKQEELADMMYSTIQEKFRDFPDRAMVYPAHGSGSLCGKSLSDANSSTLGNERMGNWAFKKQTKEEFTTKLLESQPFIPSYFGYDVDMNRAGAETVRKAVADIPFKLSARLEAGMVVDTREEGTFKKGHIPGSINIQAASEEFPFETWLGSIIKPGEGFHLVIENPKDLGSILDRVVRIGYERQLKSVVTLPSLGLEKSAELDIEDFKKNPERYTIVDVRNKSEVDEGKYFENSLSHPLNNLRETADNIPTNKPVVVHCAGGYRSAAGSSILAKVLKDATIFDLSDTIRDFEV